MPRSHLTGTTGHGVSACNPASRGLKTVGRELVVEVDGEIGQEPDHKDECDDEPVIVAAATHGRGRAAASENRGKAAGRDSKKGKAATISIFSLESCCPARQSVSQAKKFGLA